MKQCEENWNTQNFTKLNLVRICYSHEVEKTEILRSLQEIISIKKDPM